MSQVYRRPPPPTEKGARTRSLILARAGELFTEQGIGSTTSDDIAAAAGVSVGTIYKHFGNKQAIVVEWASSGFDALQRDLDLARDHEEPWDRLLAAGDAYLAFAAKNPGPARLLTQMAVEVDRDTELAQCQADLAARIHTVMLSVADDFAHVKTMAEYSVPVDETVVMIWGLWSGVIGLMLRTDQVPIPPELAERAVARARKMMQRAAAHVVLHPGPPDTWPTELPDVLRRPWTPAPPRADRRDQGGARTPRSL